MFGPFENFAVVTMALVLIASLSEGSFVKALMAGLLGMLVAMPGIDETSGGLRLTFGFTELNAGLNILRVIIGMFALNQRRPPADTSPSSPAPTRSASSPYDRNIAVASDAPYGRMTWISAATARCSPP